MVGIQSIYSHNPQNPQKASNANEPCHCHECPISCPGPCVDREEFKPAGEHWTYCRSCDAWTSHPVPHESSERTSPTGGRMTDETKSRYTRSVGLGGRMNDATSCVNCGLTPDRHNADGSCSVKRFYRATAGRCSACECSEITFKKSPSIWAFSCVRCGAFWDYKDGPAATRSKRLSPQ